MQTFLADLFGTALPQIRRGFEPYKNALEHRKRKALESLKSEELAEAMVLEAAPEPLETSIQLEPPLQMPETSKAPIAIELEPPPKRQRLHAQDPPQSQVYQPASLNIERDQSPRQRGSNKHHPTMERKHTRPKPRPKRVSNGPTTAIPTPTFCFGPQYRVVKPRIVTHTVDYEGMWNDRSQEDARGRPRLPGKYSLELARQVDEKVPDCRVYAGSKRRRDDSQEGQEGPIHPRSKGDRYWNAFAALQAQGGMYRSFDFTRISQPFTPALEYLEHTAKHPPTPPAQQLAHAMAQASAPQLQRRVQERLPLTAQPAQYIPLQRHAGLSPLLSPVPPVHPSLPPRVQHHVGSPPESPSPPVQPPAMQVDSRAQPVQHIALPGAQQHVHVGSPPAQPPSPQVQPPAMQVDSRAQPVQHIALPGAQQHVHVGSPPAQSPSPLVQPPAMQVGSRAQPVQHIAPPGAQQHVHVGSPPAQPPSPQVQPPAMQVDSRAQPVQHIAPPGAQQHVHVGSPPAQPPSPQVQPPAMQVDSRAQPVQHIAPPGAQQHVHVGSPPAQSPSTLAQQPAMQVESSALPVQRIAPSIGQQPLGPSLITERVPSTQQPANQSAHVLPGLAGEKVGVTVRAPAMHDPGALAPSTPGESDDTTGEEDVEMTIRGQATPAVGNQRVEKSRPLQPSRGKKVARMRIDVQPAKSAKLKNKGKGIDRGQNNVGQSSTPQNRAFILPPSAPAGPSTRPGTATPPRPEILIGQEDLMNTIKDLKGPRSNEPISGRDLAVILKGLMWAISALTSNKVRAAKDDRKGEGKGESEDKVEGEDEDEDEDRYGDGLTAEENTQLYPDRMKRKTRPRNRNAFLRHIRDSCANWMGRNDRKSPFPLPTEEEIAAYASRKDPRYGPSIHPENPTQHPFKFDVSRPITTLWNRRCVEVFVAEYTSLSNALSKDYDAVLHAIRTHHKALSLQWKNLNVAILPSDMAQKLVHTTVRQAKYSRRRELCTRRLDGAGMHKDSVIWIPLIRAAGEEAQSDDETVIQGGRVIALTSILDWRSEEFVAVLSCLDCLQVSSKFTPDGRPKTVHIPRFRMKGIQRSSREAVSGLPANCYSEAWKMAMGPFVVTQLKMKPPIDLNISEELEQCIMRYRNFWQGPNVTMANSPQ